jgi:hypothetical protein
METHLCKIKKIGDALVAEGFEALDEQAEVLGLPRSTTWTILRANHKKSGISPRIISRMLKAPRLPRSVRTTILNYVEEKTEGSLGHNRKQQQRFAAGLKRVEMIDFPGPGKRLAERRSQTGGPVVGQASGRVKARNRRRRIGDRSPPIGGPVAPAPVVRIQPTMAGKRGPDQIPVSAAAEK